MSEIKTVIFDWDGTIAQSMHVLFAGFNELHKHGLANFKFDSLEELKQFLDREFITSYYNAIGVKEENRKKADEIFMDLTSKIKDSVQLYDGMPEVLAKLKCIGYQVGIVSSNDRKFINYLLNKHRVSHLIDIVIGHYDAEKNKPHKEPIIKCLDILKSKPSECCGIGDSLFDMMANKEAEVKRIIGAAYGYHPSHLKDADVLAYSPREILLYI